MATILVFGDSGTEGYFDIEKGGWVTRLKLAFDKKDTEHNDFWCMVRNLGVSGNTSRDLLRRFDNETRERAGDDMVIVFSIGKNDSAYREKIGNPNISESEFKANIIGLIGLARKYRPKIIFLAIQPVDEEKVYFKPWIGPKPWAGSNETAYFHSNTRIRKFNAILKAACKTHKVYFIDVFSAFWSKNYKKLLYDGLHANAAGHELIFKTVKNFLYKNGFVGDFKY